MPFNIYASPVPVAPEHRDTMLGMRYGTEKEVLAKAAELRRAGWIVYRVTGPGGIELTDNPIEPLSDTPPP